MRRILPLFLFLMVLFNSSCKKNIQELNINPNRPLDVPSGSLFANASVDLSDMMAHTNVNYNNFRLFVQYWTETIYRDETRYNLNQRSIPDIWWRTLYRDVLRDLLEATRQIDTEDLPAATKKNRKAMNEMLSVYAYYVLITTFGNVPYSAALDIENIQPKYDDAQTIFDDLARRLDNALAALDIAEEGYGSADLLLGGDVAGWARFGNCLKMRMGMLIADSDPVKSKQMVESAAPNVMMSNDQNIKFHYLSSPPNTNPVWEDLVQSGRHDFVAARPFIDTLKAHNDSLRLQQFFDPAISSGEYVGQRPGNRASFNDFSAPSTHNVADPTAPFTFFDYAEMEFYKAEAIERGYNVGGTAESHYNNAVTASIEDWGGTAMQASTYLAMPENNYVALGSDWKHKIGVQSWISFYNRGYDAWTQWRRLDYPNLELPNMGAVDPFEDGETPSVIVRMNYPVVEQNLNKANWQAASNAIGHDWKTQKLWFDKF